MSWLPSRRIVNLANDGEYDCDIGYLQEDGHSHGRERQYGPSCGNGGGWVRARDRI